ncbi:hypothetical protein JTE90_013446 [Oedothorax gibbosus]|uniref:Transmembrane protein 131 n=1 Tax=Oedothorax gibbosus TaxID=931172 RepID=A0AAV6VN33_9ARAC|nr:hypothetical protein JTE90_013446 [Oedothorax gibbosus]
MKTQNVFQFLLLYNVLETMYRLVQAGDGRTHAFVHVDGDLRYLIDGVSMEMQEFYREEGNSAISFTDSNEENLNAYASPISFHPPMLNFNFHPVGMPHMKRVIVQNLSPDTSIHMLSISGNTLHTHCSFFLDKVIPPGSNTSFDVVLLAREEGPVEDTLFIHTSLGSFKFQVSAIGVPNPYRLRPYVGVRMPLNSSFTPIIYMHNPHSTTLKLTEMYSSGGDLHLELPDGDSETSQSLWEIPPFESKPIIKANFIARVEKNHTAFIRIRTNSSGQDYLLLPVEVDVSSAPGIYSPSEIIDFGVLRSHDEPKVVTLSLLNSGQKHVHVQNVIATPVNEAVDVKFIPLKIPPDTVFTTQVATITFTPSRALHPKQCCGKIVIKSKNNQYKLQIPYQVQLIRGFLDYNKNCTRFYVGTQNSSNTKEFNVTNNFSVVIIVYNVSLPDEVKEHFTVNFTKPVVLRPGESGTVAFITFKPSLPDLHLTSYLRLHTNISHVDIPLLCFTGRLKLFLPHAVNESFIDFGTVGIGDKRTVIFAVINENPVDVNLKFWGSNNSKTYVELVGVDKGNASTLAWRQNFSAMARSLILKPLHYAIFRIGITAPNHEGIVQGQAYVETQYEKMNIPFGLRTAKGALKVDELVFENSFPGKISTKSLHVLSTFSHPMTITGISTVPEDLRFVFDPSKYGTPVLHPNTKNMVGKIHFDHRKYCKQKCYSGLPTTTAMGHQWLLGMALPTDVGEMDAELFHTLSKRWHSLIDLEEKITNITLRIDTTEVRGYLLKAQASLQWPRMFSKYHLKFPITQIGNHSVKDFTLENPSSLPVIVQIVPLSLYPNTAKIIKVLKERYGDSYGASNVLKDSEVFTLEDLEENNHNPDNHIPAYRESLEEFFGIQSHKKSIAMLLTPGMRVRIQVGFTPKDDSLKSSLILIRNNLTVMDALLVHGQGGYGQITLGNIPSGSDSILMFELTDNLLKDCYSLKSDNYVPNFTVRRAFTARNTGALPMYVKGFDISGKFCQGYGFRILNCQPFELQPNATKKIDIAYTPDFSLTHIERILNIHTSQGPQGKTIQYKVVATVPRHLLAFCSQSVPRPFWETYLYLIFVCLSLVMIVTVVVCGYLDSQRLLNRFFYPMITIGISSEKMEKENVFDLNAICSVSSENGYIKDSYSTNEIEMKKEIIFENKTITENGTIVNSLKNSETPIPKRKDSQNSKEIEDVIADYRQTKKRSSKKHNQEKETSSTTTETSTTESEISEKDNRLPDVCVTSKTQKNRYSKNKSREIVLNSTNRLPQNLRNKGTGTKGFELSTKSKSHKKVKVESAKIYTGNILQPSSLELPYKPSSSIGNNEALAMLCANGVLSAESFRIKDDQLNNIAEETSNLGPYQGIPNCLWLKYPSEFNKSILPFELSKQPSSYSAAVSKDILNIKEKNEFAMYGLRKNCIENTKPSIARIKRSHNHSSKKLNKNSVFLPNHWSSDNTEQLTTSEIESKLLGSKLRNWMLQSSPGYYSYNEILGVSKDENMNSPNSQTKSVGCDNWPGFDITPVKESFWDSNYNPTGDSWSENSDINPLNPNSIWNGSLASVWAPDSTSSWSSPSCDNSNSLDDNSITKSVLSEPEILIENKESAAGEFDPFHTPSALWISQLKERNENVTSSNPNTWSFSLFSNEQAILSENTQEPVETEKEIDVVKSDNSA